MGGVSFSYEKRPHQGENRHQGFRILAKKKHLSAWVRGRKRSSPRNTKNWKNIETAWYLSPNGEDPSVHRWVVHVEKTLWLRGGEKPDDKCLHSLRKERF